MSALIKVDLLGMKVRFTGRDLFAGLIGALLASQGSRKTIAAVTEGLTAATRAPAREPCAPGKPCAQCRAWKAIEGEPSTKGALT